MSAKKVKRAVRPKLYVKKGIASRWRKEIKSGDPVLVFSPYITGPCAEKVLLVAGGGEIELYTVFSAENFAAGASSLRCLRRILASGVKVYHLPGLHAKMLLVPGRMLTVGSQNLTKRGTRNREATVLITDAVVIDQAEKEVKAWIADRVPVTSDMVEDLSSRVPEVSRLFAAAKEAAGLVDDHVKQDNQKRNERARIHEESRRQEEERLKLEAEAKQRHDRAEGLRRKLQLLREAACRVRQPSARVLARVSLITTQNPRTSAMTSTISLTVDGTNTLTQWPHNGRLVELDKCYRYLCIMEETGKLGWARVCSTRISFIESDVERTWQVDFRGRKWQVTFGARWSDLEAVGCNLVVTLKCEAGEVCLDCWFSIEQLAVERAEWQPGSIPPYPSQDIASAVAQNEAGIQDELIRLLLIPFTYRKGSKLIGKAVNAFYGNYGSKVVVRLAKVRGRELLLASPA